MSQSTINDYFAIIKKKPEDLGKDCKLITNHLIDDIKINQEIKTKINTNDLNQSNKKLNEQNLDTQSKKPSNVKKRLFDEGGSNSKLDELREKIRLNSNVDFLNKLKDFKDKTASPIKLQINSLSSPSKRLKEREERRAKANELIEKSPKKFLEEKLINSPIKKTAAKLKTIDGLNLPSKYKSLINCFHCLDSVVSMLVNRLETCTFDKIKSGIQKITKKNFDLSHLAQILTIYPNSYTLSYEKKTSVDNLNNLKILTKQSPFYLVLAPKINSIKMTPTILKKRRDEFENLINKYARELHNNYLLSLDPPVVIKDDELTRWHPSFIFPNIKESELPEAPVSINETKSIDEFWATKLNIEKPIVKKIDNNKSIPTNKKDKITKGVLKGLSQDFLEKIKNKEAINLAKDITRKPETVKKIAEIKKLPELIRTIHSLFTVEKKKAILLSNVIKKCSDSSTTFSTGNCSELIHLLNELLPDWLLILKTSQGTFIKINKETVLKSLYDRLDRKIISLKDN